MNNVVRLVVEKEFFHTGDCGEGEWMQAPFWSVWGAMNDMGLKAHVEALAGSKATFQRREISSGHGDGPDRFVGYWTAQCGPWTRAK